MKDVITSIFNDLTFDKVLVKLIFFLLFLSSLRDILKAFGVCKKIPYISSWVYGDAPEKYIKESVKETLMAVGLGNSHTMHQLKIINSAVKNKTLRPSSDLERLVVFISKHIYRHDRDFLYGMETPTKSKFYINTMDASLDVNECKEMVQIIYGLYTEIYKQTKPLDFIVVPKLGNPTFAKELCREIGNCQLLIVKPDTDRSRLHGTNSEITSTSNIEGLNLLISRAKTSDKGLNGAIVDCNCSGGSSLINAAKILNSTIEENCLHHISPVVNILTIFRADTDLSPNDIDMKFSQNGLKLYRILDLDEEAKTGIMGLKEMSGSDPDFYHKAAPREEIQAIINSARSRGLVIDNR